MPQASTFCMKHVCGVHGLFAGQSSSQRQSCAEKALHCFWHVAEGEPPPWNDRQQTSPFGQSPDCLHSTSVP